MGSRYGRNQKRRHRERIAELEKQNGKLWSDNSQAWGKVAKLRFELKELFEAIDAVQPLSALLKPTLVTLDPDQLRHLPFEQLNRLPMRELRVEMDPFGSVSLERMEHWLFEITTEIRANPASFRHAIHLIARSPKETQQTNYFVDMAALKRAVDLPHVFSHVFEKMIHALVKAQQTGVIRAF